MGLAGHTSLAVFASTLLILSGCEPQPDAARSNERVRQLQAQVDAMKGTLAEVNALKAKLETQQSVQPEQCVLDTVRGATSTEVGFIRWNCIRAYIKFNLPSATRIVSTPLDNATLQWVPAAGLMAALPPPEYRENLNEHVTVTLLNNNASFQIIAADILIVDNATRQISTYLGYADAPIEPHAVGKLTALVDVKVPANQTFNDTHSWQFGNLYAVSVQPAGGITP